MSSEQSDFLSGISWPYCLRITEWPVEWAGAASTTVDHADMRESTQPRRAVVITRPQLESRRVLSLGTRVSSTLPLNDNEGSPVTAPPPAHSSIHSRMRLDSIVCLFTARLSPGERSGAQGEPARQRRGHPAIRCAHFVCGFLTRAPALIASLFFEHLRRLQRIIPFGPGRSFGGFALDPSLGRRGLGF